MSKPRPVYRRLTIVAASPKTDIWLADDQGHLVQTETGTLETEVMKGYYTVEFGLGSTTYPINLTRNRRCTEIRFRCGPSCPRPFPDIAGMPVKYMRKAKMRKNQVARVMVRLRP